MQPFLDWLLSHAAPLVGVTLGAIALWLALRVFEWLLLQIDKVPVLTHLADPQKRRAIVRFVRAVADATAALKKNPEPHLEHISGVLGFTVEQIRWGWPETEFPVRIIPDMLDVLETEERWLAGVSNRAPRSRAELEKFIDRSVVEEALALELDQ